MKLLAGADLTDASDVPLLQNQTGTEGKEKKTGKEKNQQKQPAICMEDSV